MNYDVKILLVDDEPDLLETLCDLLSDDYANISTVKDGLEALQLLERESFNVIVSDYNMPHLDGLELIKSLREQGNPTPVIWLSGKADQELFRQAWAHGAFDFFTKPFDINKIQDAIKSAVEFGKSAKVEIKPHYLNAHSKEIPIVLNEDVYHSAVELSLKLGVSLSSLVNHVLTEQVERLNAKPGKLKNG